MARIYLLHLNEATAGTRPTAWVNSVSGGPSFLNKGNLGDTGAVSEVSGSMPFGAGAFTQSGGSNRTAITSSTQVTFTGDFTMQGFTGSPLEGNSFIAQFSTNGTDGGAMRIQLLAIDEGGGSFSFLCFGQQVANSGFFAFQTAAIAPSTVAGVSGYHWALQREGDYLTFRCNGSLRATATTPLTGSLTGYIDPFGAYEQATGGCGGEAQIRISELAGDDTAVYTGSTYTVPTARFANPGGGTTATTATAAAGAATVSRTAAATSRTAGAAAAGLATTSAVGRATTRAASAAAAGLAAVSAVGRALLSAAAVAAAGIATASAVGSSTSGVSSTATAANGAATVSASGGAAVAVGLAPAASAATVSALAAATTRAAPSPAAGVATSSTTAAAAGKATAAPANGIASVSALTGSGQGSNAVPITGTASVAASAVARTAGAASPASGAASVSAVGAVIATRDAAPAAGSAITAAAGAALARTTGTATGIASVSGAGSTQTPPGDIVFEYSERVLTLPAQNRIFVLAAQSRTIQLSPRPAGF